MGVVGVMGAQDHGGSNEVIYFFLGMSSGSYWTEKIFFGGGSPD